jgi:quinol monooxygenase YgiN
METAVILFSNFRIDSIRRHSMRPGVALQMGAPKMFITLHAFRAQEGEEDAITALYESWILRLKSQDQGFISGDIFTDLMDPQAFISINRFDSELSARKSEQDPEFVFWFNRVASLTESKPHQAYYRASSYLE